MTLSMYRASVPVFVQGLTSLSNVLAKATAYAEERKIDPQALLQARLYPDMFPLTRQVQTACDFAKGATARLAGADVPRFEDVEKTFDELGRRIERTIDFMGTLDGAAMEGAEGRDISFPVGGRTMTLKGLPYLLNYALPNYWFHVTTTYGILRHNGVQIGKRDFIGRIPD